MNELINHVQTLIAKSNNNDCKEAFSDNGLICFVPSEAKVGELSASSNRLQINQLQTSAEHLSSTQICDKKASNSLFTSRLVHCNS
jgi:hypothetical protein